MAEEASGFPGTVDPVVEVVGDVASVQLMMVMNEAEFAELALELAQPVYVDRGGSVVWEGAGDHGAVLKGGSKAMDGRSLGLGLVWAWWGKVAEPGEVIRVASLIGYGEHAFNVVLVISLIHTSVVSTRNEGAKGLELLFVMATVVGRVGRGCQEAGSVLVEAVKVEGDLEPHMGLGWEVTQVAEVFNEGPPSLVGENVVDAGRVGALRGAVPVLKPPVGVLEVVRRSLGDV